MFARFFSSIFSRKIIVQLEQGSLEGGEDKSLTTGRKFYTFYGIPYAEPPVGELRFRPPVPAGKWTGTRDGRTPRDWCIQDDKTIAHATTTGSEDCLYLNVFTPEPPKPKKPLKPVMVQICGGSFYFSGEPIVGSFDHLVDYDVIMVTISYRLNIFGYFNMNIPSCAGNCGAKDVVLALKWLKNNIQVFGGDPNNLTLYGECAGATTINMLSLSPMAEGLFHKAIISSGNALSSWAYNDDQVDAGFRVGHALGFTGTNVEELVEFLRRQPAEALKDAAREVYRNIKQKCPYIVHLVFTPSREKFAEGAFLTDTPANLIKTGYPVPTIVGVSEKEGYLILFAFNNSEQFRLLNRDMGKAINYKHQPSSSTRTVYPYRLPQTKELLDRKAVQEQVRRRMLDFYSDFVHNKFYDSFEYVIKSSQPFYIFEFAYVGSMNESPYWRNGLEGYDGQGDGNNYVNLFRDMFPNPQTNEADKTMIRKMCTMYTNFARTGNPNPDPTQEVIWEPHTLQWSRYLRIDSKSKMINGEIFEKGRAYWSTKTRTQTPNN